MPAPHEQAVDMQAYSDGSGRAISAKAHPMLRDGVIENKDYQRRLVGKALGKTVIAELVAAELLYRHPGCRILIMAPTKPLAFQHRERYTQ
jgi:Fanconi anemia group M protein